jgi:hypothetical protein
MLRLKPSPTAALVVGGDQKNSDKECGISYIVIENIRLMKKTQLLETIQDMPEEFSVDELMERLMILQKIEEGQQQIQAGQFYTEEEAKKKLEKWLK